MKTNRDKLLQDAFVMFLQYNYERASYTLLTQATGISKAGISYYYPTKQELFVAVVDRFVFEVHDADVKFAEAESFPDFIDCFVDNVRQTMSWYVAILEKAENIGSSTAYSNFFAFIMQIQRYYPDAETKLQAFWSRFQEQWYNAVSKGVERGELRQDIDIDVAADMFNNVYLGMSFMKSFTTGLDVDDLRKSFHRLYLMIKR